MMHPFIDRMALRNAVNAALQRGEPVYAPGLSAQAREELKEDIKAWLTSLGKRYVHWEYNADLYHGEIAALRQRVNEKHGKILAPGMITLGVAQKCISLYLKYLWLAGNPEKMPVFPPIDGLLMKELGVTSPAGFKQIETREQLDALLLKANQRAVAQGFRTATLWEAEWWNDRKEEESESAPNGRC